MSDRPPALQEGEVVPPDDKRTTIFTFVAFFVLMLVCAWVGTNAVKRWERGLEEDRVIYRALGYARAAARLTEAGRGQATPHLRAYGNAVGEGAPDVLRHLVIDLGTADQFGVRRDAEVLWSLHGYTGEITKVDRPVSDRANHLSTLFEGKDAERQLRLSELIEVNVQDEGYLRIAAYAPIVIDGKHRGLGAALLRVEQPTSEEPTGLWLLAALAVLICGLGLAFLPGRRLLVLVGTVASLGIVLTWYVPQQLSAAKRGHLSERAQDWLTIQSYADSKEAVALVSPVPGREPWSTDGALRLEREPGTKPAEAIEEGAMRVGGPTASAHVHESLGHALSGGIDLATTGWVVFGVVLLGICIGPIGRLLANIWTAPGTYAYTAPAIIGMLVLVIVPFLTGVGLSFYRYFLEGNSYEYIGMGNFAEIMAPQEGADINFWWTLGVTVLWTSSNVILHVSIGLALALVLNRAKLRGRKLYRTLLILPWAIPNYITALMWRSMFIGESGPINSLLGSIGVGPISWFDNNFWTNFIPNLVANTWLGFPFMMVVCLGALQSIPAGLYEAAQLDGASAWQRLKMITIPLIKPALLPAIILGTIWTFNMFNIIYLVSMGAGGTEILITEAYRAFHEQHRHGYAAAYAVLIFLILMSYTLVTNKVTKATEGAMA